MLTEKFSMKEKVLSWVAVLFGGVFVYIRLGLLAVAFHVLIGGLLHQDVAKWPPIALCVAYCVSIIGLALHSAVKQGGPAALARMQADTVRSSAIFWISAACVLMFFLASMVAGERAALVVGDSWLVLASVLLLYALLRLWSPACPRVAVLEGILGERRLIHDRRAAK